MQFMFNFYTQRVHMRIRFFILSLVLLSAQIFNLQTLNAEASNEDMVKAGAGLLGSGVVIYITDEFGNNHRVKQVGEKTGINPKDAANVVAISGGLVALSYIAKENTQKGLRDLAWRAPIAAGVAAIVYTETFQKIAKHVPVIGKTITCDNHECKGICNNCKLTKTTIAIGIYRMVNFGLGLIPNPLGGNDDRRN